MATRSPAAPAERSIVSCSHPAIAAPSGRARISGDVTGCRRGISPGGSGASSACHARVGVGQRRPDISEAPIRLPPADTLVSPAADEASDARGHLGLLLDKAVGTTALA